MSREKSLAEYSQKVEEAYRRRTPKSRQAVEEWANKYAPGGDYRKGRSGGHFSSVGAMLLLIRPKE